MSEFIQHVEGSIPIRRVTDVYPDLSPHPIDWFQLAIDGETENWTFHFVVEDERLANILDMVTEHTPLVVCSDKHNESRIIKYDEWAYKGYGIFRVHWQQPRLTLIKIA